MARPENLDLAELRQQACLFDRANGAPPVSAVRELEQVASLLSQLAEELSPGVETLAAQGRLPMPPNDRSTPISDSLGMVVLAIEDTARLLGIDLGLATMRQWNRQCVKHRCNDCQIAPLPDGEPS